MEVYLDSKICVCARTQNHMHEHKCAPHTHMLSTFLYICYYKLKMFDICMSAYSPLMKHNEYNKQDKAVYL
jgi:hypothetical protein